MGVIGEEIRIENKLIGLIEGFFRLRREFSAYWCIFVNNVV